ncbi:hypothetical protein E6O75_ATG03931 [Venturia nashicola]|uniref:Uncharacterized protein n=1 Tax=Venturia nashicola TaxID=86259 RepID=A0A4Z1PCF1_9PEZI|nr:hypothetical protein E6O75_ATG03931 [Venturia nashicola]
MNITYYAVAVLSIFFTPRPFDISHQIAKRLPKHLNSKKMEELVDKTLCGVFLAMWEFLAPQMAYPSILFSRKAKSKDKRSIQPEGLKEFGKVGEGSGARDAWKAGEAWIAGEVWGAGNYGHNNDCGMKSGCSASRANGNYAESELECIYGHKETYEKRKTRHKHEARCRRRGAILDRRCA